MNITRDAAIEEILELWVRYSKDFIDKKPIANESIKKVNKIREILDIRGVFFLEIDIIEDSSYTVSYSYGGSRVVKKIPIK